MPLFKNIRDGLRNFFRREQEGREIDDELRGYLEASVEEKMRSGDTSEAALRAARRELGSAEAAKEHIRAAGWEHLLESVWQDLRYAARALRRSPGFSAVAILTLALGIGANTAIFSVVSAVLLRPLPYPHPERLVFVRGTSPFRNEPHMRAHMEPADWLSQNRSFERTAIYVGGEVNLAGADHPERVKAVEVSDGFFPAIGIAPLGRAFLPEESIAGRDQVAILSSELCSRFGAPQDVIGRTITVNAKPLTVVGVMPGGFRFPGRTQIWLPLPLPWSPDKDGVVTTAAIYSTIVARLRPGVSLSQAQDEVIPAAAQPPGNLQDARASVHVTRIDAALLSSFRPVLMLLLGAVALVLLIACADVANLLLTRAVLRQKEIALRAALGAGRARLIRQNLTESILLAVLAAAAGLSLAEWSLRTLRILIPPNMLLAGQIQLDGRVLAFTLGISLASGILFGLFPAFHSFRLDLNQSLKEAGTGLSADRGLLGRARSVLAISEVALALTLLIGAGLVLKSFSRLSAVNPGFHVERVLTSRISLGEGLYRQPERRAQFYAEALRHTAALPGVRDASFASDLPLSGAVSAAFQFDVKEKNPARATGDAQLALYNAVSSDYFRAMGIPMLAGRAFTDADRSGAPKVVVVSESLAKAYWPGENPLGKHVNVSSSLPNPEWSEVVGVAGDTRHFSPAAEPSEELYAPLQQEPPLGAYLIVRSVGDPVTIAGALRGAIAGVDSNEPVSELLTMEQRLSTSISPQRFRTILLSIFAGLALLLSAAGIFGVISYWATQRTREIGIRMALGAKRSDVLRLVLGQGMRLTAIGVGLGLAAAFAFSRFIASLLFGVGPDDPLTFAGVTLVLTGVSALACWIPARRAARVDPIVALRHD